MVCGVVIWTFKFSSVHQATHANSLLPCGLTIRRAERIASDYFHYTPYTRSLSYNNVKSIENNDAIVHLKELKVTQKELLGDLIDNQLLLTSGKPPYCVLCGRKKVNKISSSCVRCQHKSTEAIKCCLKCKQLKEYTSDYTALCADSGHQCLHTESFKLCFKCKELKEYTTSNPSFGEGHKVCTL